MLRMRVVSGTLSFLVLCGVFALDHRAGTPIALAVGLALIAAWGAGEFCRMAVAAGESLRGGLTVVVTAAVAAMPYVLVLVPMKGPMGIQASALCGAAVVLFAVYCREEDLAAGMRRLALSLFCVSYIGFSLSFVLFIWMLAPKGIWAALMLLASAKAGDIGAYFVGKAAGKHHMASVISPNKTWEGAGASCVVTVIVALIINWVFGIYSAGFAFLTGAVIALSGQFGDLSESFVKRALGSKDSGTGIPGFGGVLDLIDSFILAAPATYLWLFWTSKSF